jgi:hypothetical protein
LILLAFFFPVAVYLLILGGINRRSHPLMVPGVWDFIGILFAASGFLLLGGPAILSSMNDRWRQFWLFGKSGGGLGPDGVWQLWLFLSILYFGLVVAGAAFLLWRQRHLTSIYNIEPRQIERSLLHIFQRLGLNPVRSGNMYLFGLAGDASSAHLASPEGIQAPHYRPGGGSVKAEPGGMLAVPGAATAGDFLGQTAILEVETFPGMRHATLHWDPADSLFRQEIESQLQRELAHTPADESDLGGWLLVAGLGLMAVLMLGALVLLVINARMG